MKKVFQTLVDSEKGNCMQAVIASLLELDLNEVPNFIDFGKNWWYELNKFMEKQGYKHIGDLYNGERILDEYSLDNIDKYKGINGCFYASVASPKYHEKGITHAVICDKNLNIIHDPNPENKGIIFYPNSEKIGYNGIRQIWLFEKT